METDEDHATVRESFSLVQNLLFTDTLTYFLLMCRKNMVEKLWKVDTEDMYFRVGFSHRFTSPILLYIVGKGTGINYSCYDIPRTPKV